nr:hypothetical protein Itr_chr10CG03470 [Ipomoea trifida]
MKHLSSVSHNFKDRKIILKPNYTQTQHPYNGCFNRYKRIHKNASINSEIYILIQAFLTPKNKNLK